MSDEERTTNPQTTIAGLVKPGDKPRDTEAGLVIIYGEDLGKRIPMAYGTVVVGRSSKCDIQLDLESVSRNHCKLEFTGKQYKIQDLGSTNGTYVNDTLIEEAVLKHGDQIKVGRTIFKFIAGNNIEAQYHEVIYRLMTVDGLTELFNKRHFDEVLEKESSRSRRYDRTFSLIVFDIDHFKQINDEFGHLAGDAVLRKIGAVLRDRIRRDDVVARIGGEEFGILLPEVAKKGAVDLAEEVRELVEKTNFSFEGTKLSVTVSLGVAEWNSEFSHTDQLMRTADAKLYEAKNKGRNRVAS